MQLCETLTVGSFYTYMHYSTFVVLRILLGWICVTGSGCLSSLCSGPVLILALAREDAVEGWRQLLGPPSLEEAKETDPNSFRAQYSVDDSELNQLHCSDSAESAAREINYFFPPEQTVAVIKPNAFSERGELATYVCMYECSCTGYDTLLIVTPLMYVCITVYRSWYMYGSCGESLCIRTFEIHNITFPTCALALLALHRAWPG